MSTSINPALNPRVPEADGYFDVTILRSLPWTYGEIGLSNDEFAYLIRGAMHTGRQEENKDRHWWSYKRQAEDMKLGNAKISFINQLLENSGIIKIIRRPGKSNIYEYRMIKESELKVFSEIVAEERAKLEKIYDSDGVFISTKQAKGKPLVRTGERYKIERPKEHKTPKHAAEKA